MTALPVGVVDDGVEQGHRPQARIVLLDERPGVGRLVLVDPQLDHPGPGGPVAQDRRRDDRPAARLRDRPGRHLAPGERPIREVPQRLLEGDRLVHHRGEADAGLGRLVAEQLGEQAPTSFGRLGRRSVRQLLADHADERGVRGDGQPPADLELPVAKELDRIHASFRKAFGRLQRSSVHHSSHHRAAVGRVRGGLAQASHRPGRDRLDRSESCRSLPVVAGLAVGAVRLRVCPKASPSRW